VGAARPHHRRHRRISDRGRAGLDLRHHRARYRRAGGNHRHGRPAPRRTQDGLRHNRPDRRRAQLINVNDGFQLWSDTYDRDLTDIFAVQDEIGSAVVEALKVTLLGETFARSGPQKPINADAYNAYLQGIFYGNKVGPDNLKIAMSHFENAVVLEPDFASAWAELSVASAAYAGQASEHTEEALLRGREAAARALELRPGDVKARQSLARLIGDRGRIDESLNMLRSIIEADPLDQSLQLSYAGKLFDNEDFEACESVITHLLELNPSMNFGSLFLAWVVMYEGRLGNMEAAIEIYAGAASAADIPAQITLTTALGC